MAENLHVGRYKDMPAEQPIPESEKERIMHISLPISDKTVLQGADSMESCGQTATFGNNISLTINVSTEAEAKRIFAALSEGGQIIMPLEMAFWAALFGMFTDKFGINWLVNLDYENNK